MIEVPNTLYEALRKRAYVERVSMAELARRAIRQALEAEQDAGAEEEGG